MTLEFTPYAKGFGRGPPSAGPSMGLRPVPVAEWLARSPGHAAYKRAKRQRLAALGSVGFQALPGSEPAQAEALRVVGAHCGSPLDDRRRVPTGALARAAFLVEEDLCLMSQCGAAEAEYRLVAGSVASPSYWRLADKLGQELLDIHDPVPALRSRIGQAMRRFFRQLPPGRVYLRGNWFIHASGEPFRTPEDASPGAATVPAGVDGLYLRCERQTLRRLPETGTILFAIRVYLNKVTELASQPALAADVLDAFADRDALIYRTRAVPDHRAALVEWLRGVATNGGASRPVACGKPDRRAGGERELR